MHARKSVSWLHYTQAKKLLAQYDRAMIKSPTDKDKRTSEDILDLVESRRAVVKLLESYEIIFLKGIGVWLGLTFELTLHIIIELADNAVAGEVEPHHGSGSAGIGSLDYRHLSESNSTHGPGSTGDAYGESHGYNSYYSYDSYHSYDDYHTGFIQTESTPERYATRFGFEILFASVTTALLFAAMYVSGVSDAPSPVKKKKNL